MTSHVTASCIVSNVGVWTYCDVTCVLATRSAFAWLLDNSAVMNERDRAKFCRLFSVIIDANGISRQLLGPYGF